MGRGMTTTTQPLAWHPFSSAPKDGRWIIARCNDKSKLFYISWGPDMEGHPSWCSQRKSYGDGLFLPDGDWINAPQPRADGESRGD
jgi:hypothetical protein